MNNPAIQELISRIPQRFQGGSFTGEVTTINPWMNEPDPEMVWGAPPEAINTAVSVFFQLCLTEEPNLEYSPPVNRLWNDRAKLVKLSQTELSSLGNALRHRLSISMQPEIMTDYRPEGILADALDDVRNHQGSQELAIFPPKISVRIQIDPLGAASSQYEVVVYRTNNPPEVAASGFSPVRKRFIRARFDYGGGRASWESFCFT